MLSLTPLHSCSPNGSADRVHDTFLQESGMTPAPTYCRRKKPHRSVCMLLQVADLYSEMGQSFEEFSAAAGGIVHGGNTASANGQMKQE